MCRFQVLWKMDRRLFSAGIWHIGHQDARSAFFGPTPASHRDEIRPARPVTILGNVVGSTEVFRDVPEGAEVWIDRAHSKDQG